MKIDEAIKHTQTFLKVYNLFSDDQLAIETLMEASEKQMPKKPIISFIEVYFEDIPDDEECECPACHSIIGLNFIPNYCCECGQKMLKEIYEVIDLGEE